MQSWVWAFSSRKQGFEQLPHGRKRIGREQHSHPLPQQAFTAQLCPYRMQQGTTVLLGLIDNKRQ